MKNTGKEVLIITGSSGLIGSALIRRCSSYLIVGFDNDGAHYRRLRCWRGAWMSWTARREALGGTALVLPSDVADGAQVEAAAPSERQL